MSEIYEAYPEPRSLKQMIGRTDGDVAAPAMLSLRTTAGIEWCNESWNCVLGCEKVSAGCRYCYAEQMSRRLAGMAEKNPVRRRSHYLHVINNQGRWNGEVQLVHEAVELPLRWKKPSFVFVNSMSDLFHEDVPLDFILKVFDVMRRCPQHQFQILTKRSARLAELATKLPWYPNVWMGVSVEDTDNTFRIDHLRMTDAAIKFLSLEPLLGPLPGLNLSGIHWAIVGGESGAAKARPVERDWVESIRVQCAQANVQFFFKQWGKLHNNPDPSDPTAKENGGTAKGGRQLDGQVWSQMPSNVVTKDRVFYGFGNDAD